MSLLALDIGGANIKAADGLGYAHSHPFALWRAPEQLAGQLAHVLGNAPPCERLAVTMTGELCDCFATKADGVRHILAGTTEAAARRLVRIYLTDGRLATPEFAAELPRLAAASNWHALARFSGRFAPRGAALLIDIGSTTADLIPLVGGRPAAKGSTDTERLLAGELVYTGVERSPVCAIVREVPYRGKSCPVAQELFATSLDAWLMLGAIAERPDDCHTADGQTATRQAAQARLARVIAADATEFNEHDALAICEAIAAAQLNQLIQAARRVIAQFAEPPRTYLVSGQGEFLARRLIELLPAAAVVSLTEKLGSEASRAAPAHALAVLAREEWPT
jgi:(4-(4-[2-(gamma-L-glutamylamino)ethyl]phenoxymethyl)furan-2-yl)methanamine synthase